MPESDLAEKLLMMDFPDEMLKSNGTNLLNGRTVVFTQKLTVIRPLG